VPARKPHSKSWLDLACDAAVRFGHRMRDEWKAGEADAQRGAPLDDDAAPPRKPLPPRQPAWWEILRVPPTATDEEIKRAYRRLIKETHPDKAAHLPLEEQQALEHEAKQLNDAYERALKLP
jgi:DnaJ-domain-containing protein 1